MPRIPTAPSPAETAAAGVPAHRHVALLRGINVGPSTRLAMADLRAVFAGLGYTGVRTLLQSGNVVFDRADAGTVPAGEVARIEEQITAVTGVRSRVVVVPAELFRTILRQNPLVDAADPSKMIITFLDRAPAEPAAGLPDDADLAPERLIFGDHAIYQWLPDGVLKSKLPARFTENAGGPSTARNLRTATKILSLLEE